MKRFRFQALACAFVIATSAHGADRAGSTVMPGPKAQPLAEKLVPAANPAALSLPTLDNAKASTPLEENQVGVSRAADLALQPALTEQSLRWRIAGGIASAQIRVSSPGALALRAALRFESIAPELEIRVAQRAADGSLEVVAITTGAEIHKAALGITPIEHWTATTVGAEQWIELRRPAGESTRATRFRLSGVSHFVRPLFADPNAKALDFTCHVDVGCVTDETVKNDAKGVAKMVFSKDGRSFVCTGSLLSDRTGSLTPLFATAHHCISISDVAASLETWWFYFATACEQNTQAPTRLNGGSTILMADPDSDFTLLRLNRSAPAGAVFLGWDSAPLTQGQAIFGLHHPDGSWQRYSEGTYTGRVRVTDSDTDVRFLTPMNRVRFTRGIVEGGSSGSPLLTAPNVFHGTLFGSPSSNSCDSTSNTASYSEFSLTYPLVSTFLAGPPAIDDHADAAAGATVLSPVTKIVAQMNRVGDSDWFRFDFASAGRWTVSSFATSPGATLDVAGTIYDANGTTVRATNDDRSDTDFNFEMTFQVPAAGTYYVKVNSTQGATGGYGLRSVFDEYGDAFASASDLPVNTVTSGFLATATDQDWFRITFTSPGTFRVGTSGLTDTFGRLYRADGTTLISENDDTVGTNFSLSTEITAPTTLYLQVTGWEGDIGAYGLTTTFTAAAATAANYTESWWNAAESGWGLNVSHRGDVIFATLFTYAPDGRDMWLVGAALTRQANGSFSGTLYRTTGPVFNTSPWTAIASSSVGTMTLTFPGDNQGTLVYSVNGVTVTKSITKQDFGTRPTCSFTTGSLAGATNYQDIWWNAAESGWGVNVTHHGSIIFATLFTYATDSRDMWLVAPNLARQSDGSFSGALYRTTGPAFNTQPWTANAATEVGTMRFAFSSGNAGTLTYTANGVTVTKAIERQAFGSQVSVCQ